MAYETIIFTVEERIATITLNRPEAMNVWNDKMAEEISHALSFCDEEDEVRAVVITGNGQAFCAGVDLSEGGKTFGRMKKADQDNTGGFPGVHPWQIRKPVLAAINGHAIGVGVTFAMSCDIRFVAQDANLQFAFARVGVIPEFSSHAIVARVAGLSNAADLMLTGRTIQGRRFAELGLANQALPADEVLPATMKLAHEFLRTAPVAVAISKRLLWEGLTHSVGSMGEREFPLFNWIVGEADAREGVEALLECRKPDWSLRVSRDMPELLDSSTGK